MVTQLMIDMTYNHNYGLYYDHRLRSTGALIDMVILDNNSILVKIF